MSQTATQETPSTKPSKVTSILITQAQASDAQVYGELTDRFKVKVDFRPFIQIKGVEARDFRKQKVNIAEYSAIILTSKHAVDHFFRVCQEMRVDINPDWKYFCVTETTTNYLQKYIVIRKRKVFTGQKTAQDLVEVIKKHKTEKFLFPCSNIRTPEIPLALEALGATYQEAVMYGTEPADLSDMKDIKYDVIAFFSPSGVHSLLHNFPDFQQNGTRIAVFGSTTAKAVRDNNLRLDIEAPQPSLPSMAAALVSYVEKVNKGK